MWGETIEVSEGFWSEADDRAERMEALSRARDEALAREDAVVDLPSVLRLASRAVDSLVRSTLDAQGMAHVSLTGLDILAWRTSHARSSISPIA